MLLPPAAPPLKAPPHVWVKVAVASTLMPGGKVSLNATAVMPAVKLLVMVRVSVVKPPARLVVKLFAIDGLLVTMSTEVAAGPALGGAFDEVTAPAASVFV